MIEIPAAKITHGTVREVTLEIPEPYRDAWQVLAHKHNVKKSRQVYVKIGPVRKPRTTGWRSQNKHIHGHAQQIAEYTGDYKEDVIAEAKRRAVTHGYPTRENSFGHIVPVSESDITTVEAGYLIDELHHIASDIDVKLKEGEG